MRHFLIILLLGLSVRAFAQSPPVDQVSWVLYSSSATEALVGVVQPNGLAYAMKCGTPMDRRTHLQLKDLMFCNEIPHTEYMANEQMVERVNLAFNRVLDKNQQKAWQRISTKSRFYAGGLAAAGFRLAGAKALKLGRHRESVLKGSGRSMQNLGRGLLFVSVVSFVAVIAADFIYPAEDFEYPAMELSLKTELEKFKVGSATANPGHRLDTDDFDRGFVEYYAVDLMQVVSDSLVEAIREAKTL